MGYLWNSSIKGWEGEYTYDSDCLAPETIKVHRKQCMQICLNELGVEGVAWEALHREGRPGRPTGIQRLPLGRGHTSQGTRSDWFTLLLKVSSQAHRVTAYNASKS